MLTIGTDLATGHYVIRNYDTASAVRIGKADMAGLVEMLREEFPRCEWCEGTQVDGYCTDCDRNFEGDERPESDAADDDPRHDHTEDCPDCDAKAGTCCEHCSGWGADDESGEVTLP
jgi:hypothetical protein